MPKLYFVLGGAQKSGTCTANKYLRRHRALQMSRIKETHFFDDERRDWSAPDYAALDAHFPPPDGRKRGEATPITLYWRPALRRLRDYNPDIRLIFILRDPARRAFSQWCTEWSSGRETLTFADAIRGGRERVKAQAETEGLDRHLSYVERGFYGEQLAHVLSLFPAANAHCEIFEEFFADRAEGLRRIASFLGIGPFPPRLGDFHINPRPAVAYPSSLTPEDISYLSTVYRDDVAQLEATLGRPLPMWFGDSTQPRAAPAPLVGRARA